MFITTHIIRTLMFTIQEEINIATFAKLHFILCLILRKNHQNRISFPWPQIQSQSGLLLQNSHVTIASMRPCLIEQYCITQDPQLLKIIHILSPSTPCTASSSTKRDSNQKGNFQVVLRLIFLHLVINVWYAQQQGFNMYFL